MTFFPDYFFQKLENEGNPCGKKEIQDWERHFPFLLEGKETGIYQKPLGKELVENACEILNKEMSSETSMGFA